MDGSNNERTFTVPCVLNAHVQKCYSFIDATYLIIKRHLFVLHDCPQFIRISKKLYYTVP